MDNNKSSISSKEVFKLIMRALGCESKVNTRYWIMWNGGAVKESFPRRNPSYKSFFDKNTIRILSSMLSTALNMDFGKDFIEGETEQEKKAGTKKTDIDENERYDYHDERCLKYLCDLTYVAAAVCGCSEEKYNAHELQSVVLKTIFNYLNSSIVKGQNDSEENELGFEGILEVDYQNNIQFLYYVFFMYFLRDIAYGKDEIGVDDGCELLGKILLSTPFYKFIIEILPKLDSSVNFNEILGIRDPKTGKKLVNYKNKFVVKSNVPEEDDEGDEDKDDADKGEDEDLSFLDSLVFDEDDEDDEEEEDNVDPFQKAHTYNGGYDFFTENN